MAKQKVFGKAMEKALIEARNEAFIGKGAVMAFYIVDTLPYPIAEKINEALEKSWEILNKDLGFQHFNFVASNGLICFELHAFCPKCLFHCLNTFMEQCKADGISFNAQFHPKG